MGYFDEEKNVHDYIEMVKGYDGTELIKELRQYLKEGSTILELGMGPGVDLDILNKHYQVTGSDTSQVFLERYKKLHPNADIISLDATSLDISRKFDCIYSNKVLMHLTKKECTKSLKDQRKILNPDGLLFHSFWYGNKVEKHYELLFVYYTEDQLKKW